jgi:hypothetical protein
MTSSKIFGNVPIGQPHYLRNRKSTGDENTTVGFAVKFWLILVPRPKLGRPSQWPLFRLLSSWLWLVLLLSRNVRVGRKCGLTINNGWREERQLNLCYKIMVEIRYLRVNFCLKLWYGHIQDFWKPTTWIFEGLNTFESWNELNDNDIYFTVEDSDISHTSCTSIEIYILCMQRLQDYCVNCRPPPICLRLKSSIYNVIYENLVFIKYLIHKVSGSILFCLHNHNINSSQWNQCCWRTTSSIV